MTVERLTKIFIKNQIPGDAEIFVDTGWEFITDIDQIWYNKTRNLIILDQAGSNYVEHLNSHSFTNPEGKDYEMSEDDNWKRLA